MDVQQREGDFGRGAARWFASDSGDGPLLSFLAANGFPVGSYRFLLDALGRDCRVLALESRGAWPEPGTPPAHFRWQHHADDLIAFLDARAGSEPVVGIGHSIGATVTAMAAVKRPDLFSALVLIDPATVPGIMLPLGMRLLPFLAGRSDLVTRTRGRRQHWASREAFREYHAGKSAYKHFRPEAMDDYCRAGLARAGDVYALCYSREWEAWNFQHTARLWPVVCKLQVPTLLLRGEHSYLHPLREFERRTRRLGSHIRVSTLTGAGHMLPQEVPEAVADAIRQWLADNS